MFASNDPVNKNPLMNVTVGPVLYRDTETKRRHASAIKEAVSGFQKARERNVFNDPGAPVAVPLLSRVFCLPCARIDWSTLLYAMG